jgi:hypothetical protein
MKRIGLIIATVVTVLLTGVLLGRAAWAGAPAAASPKPANHVTDAADVLTGPAGWRYRHSQPTHWRSCLLQQ